MLRLYSVLVPRRAILLIAISGRDALAQAMTHKKRF